MLEPEAQHRPVGLGQPANCVANVLLQLVGTDFAVHVAHVIAAPESRAGHALLSAAFPTRVVGEHTAQPRQHRSATLVLRGFFDCGQERRLHQVFGLRGVTRQVACQSQQLGRGAIEDDRERGGFAFCW